MSERDTEAVVVVVPSPENDATPPQEKTVNPPHPAIHGTKVPLKAWVILFISSFGVFMASVSTSALIIAFPDVLTELHMTMSTMMWVLLVIMLMLGTVVPVAGKLGDIVGQAVVYKFGYWCFVCGSLGAGFVDSSQKGFDLIGARVVIGFGAALLFTNSSAIITNAFAPYGKVGLSTGVFQVFSGLGMVLGPLIGGALAKEWRWIFWFNVPPGGLCAILAMFVLTDDANRVRHSAKEHLRRFDFIGAIFCMLALVLILIAMIQAVAPDPVLSTDQSLTGLCVGGGISAIIFIVDQFFAVDPLIPPSIFKLRVFDIGLACGTLMAFVRNSVTYNMIFYLQGPLSMDPLQAGIELIPYGIGSMVGGFFSGGMADKVGIKPLIIVGALVTLAGAACLSVMDENTTKEYVGGILFLTGLGTGLFNSPNSMMTMLSVPARQRGVAAAMSMLTMAITMMLGITITFSLVLHSMTQAQLYAIFLSGGGVGSKGSLRPCLDAIAKDYYIVIAFCGAAALIACFLPNDVRKHLAHLPAAGKGGAAPGSDEEQRAGRVQEVSDELMLAMEAGDELVLPGYLAADPSAAACVDGGAGAGTPFAEVAELPAGVKGRDLREAAGGAEAGVAYLALAGLVSRGEAVREWEEGARVHRWRRAHHKAGADHPTAVLVFENSLGGGGPAGKARLAGKAWA